MKYTKPFLDHLRSKRYSERTIRAYAYELDRLEQFASERGFTTHTVENQLLDAYAAHLEQRSLSPYTIRRALLVIKKYSNYTAKRHHRKNPFKKFEMPRLQDKNQTVEYLDHAECEHLIKTIATEATPYYRNRDLMIIRLLLATGMRVSELCGLRVCDVNLQQQTLLITRKGGKKQSIPISPELSEGIAYHIKRTDVHGNDPLFMTRLHSAITPKAVYILVRKYLAMAGIQKRKNGPHLLRHSCFSNMLDKQVNVRVIQRLAGHQSINTTLQYLHVRDEQLKSAVTAMTY